MEGDILEMLMAGKSIKVKAMAPKIQMPLPHLPKLKKL
jgi:hypothetical protein